MSIASEILSIHEKSRKWYKDQYSSGFSDALKDASKVAERRELELFDQIRRLRAVIDELPDVAWKYDPADGPMGCGCKIEKSSLLAKHGVEG